MWEGQFYFRRMCAEDVAAVSEIERVAFSRPWSEQSFAQALRQDTLFVTAMDENTVLGYCGMYCCLDEGEITNVAVAPDSRRQGIGRGMMEYLLSLAWEKGIVRVILEVRISNKNAIHLYQTLGFQNCGIRKNFYDMPKEDGMVMVLER